jgi:hypothetical protein
VRGEHRLSLRWFESTARGKTRFKIFETPCCARKRSACVRMSHVPSDADSLIAYQQQLATSTPRPWIFDQTTSIIGACWMCFSGGVASPGTDHDPAWSRQ